MEQHGRGISRAREVLVHENPWWKVFFDEVVLPNGSKGRHLRLVPAASQPGVVILAVRNGAKEPEIAFVKQNRYAVDALMLELPRGFAEPEDTNPSMSASREFAEETGLTASCVTVLGEVRPDSAIIASHAVVCLVEPDAAAQEMSRDGEVFDVFWVKASVVRSMVASGQITDGFSLAALAYWWASSKP
jgi:ADP-ribose pyrophosphatase